MTANQRHRQTRKVTLVGAGVNCCLSLSQIIFGVFGHSQALLADGLHTLSDLSSDFIVLIAAQHSARAADENHPYGHGRIETLASVVLALILIAVGIGIGYRGIASLYEPVQIDPAGITIIFAGLAVVAKEFLYHYTLRVARRIHSALLESNAWHHRSDALSSIVVLTGISAQLLGIAHADAIAATIVAAMVIFIGLRLGRKAIYELIDTGLDIELIERIKARMSSHPGVEAIHSLRSRSMGGLGYIDSEIMVNPRLTVSEAHYIAFKLEQLIKVEFPRIIDISLHIDPLTESRHDAVKDLPARHEVLDYLNAAWQDIPEAAQIKRIQLHYLNTQIEVDIIYQSTNPPFDQEDGCNNLVEAAKAVPDIGKVTLYYYH